LDATVAAVLGDIALVFVVAALLGTAAQRCGQPAVIGQILTGVILGPSLLGHLTRHLFPTEALPYLNVLSQVAVVIFMFAVGYETGFLALRAHGRVLPSVALGAFLVPLGLGMACALLLRPELASMGIDHEGRSLVLFMGVAMSITALPVLACIVRERNLAGTTAGVVATGAAGIMDVLAWLLLRLGHADRDPSGGVMVDKPAPDGAFRPGPRRLRPRDGKRVDHGVARPAPDLRRLPRWSHDARPGPDTRGGRASRAWGDGEHALAAVLRGHWAVARYWRAERACAPLAGRDDGCRLLGQGGPGLRALQGERALRA
jgi:Sodium/hydrogen exchanger family